MNLSTLGAACEIPPGRWAVGVSGGADSVALLLLLRGREGLDLHIAHLDHQTRGQASTDDAHFVKALAEKLGIPASICRRDEIEPTMASLPNNLSARFRAIRLEYFRRVVERENLLGVILAHQADDQAETILLRLLRGSGPAGLAGMRSRVRLGGLTILRPLLQIRREDLRKFLIERGQSWREDSTNTSDKYARNRVRKFLESGPRLHEGVLALGRACAAYSKWISLAAPRLDDKFPAVALGELPRALARESARRWLTSAGVPQAEMNAEIADRLCQMAADAATAAKQTFPSEVIVSRRSGWIARRK